VNNFPFRFFQISARIFFALTILLMPFRLRLVLWTRPFFPVYADYTDFLLFASDASLLFTLVFWMCSLWVAPRKVKLGNISVSIFLGGLTLAAWVSTLDSVDPILSRYQAVRFVFLLFFYLYIVNEISSVGWVVVPVALQGLLQAPVAIGQFLSQSSLGFQILGEHVLDPQVLGTSILPVNGERILRAYGLADHPNILGGCFTFVLILLFVVVLYGKDRRPYLAGLAFLIIFPALLLTFSRSAWVSLFVAMTFLFVCSVFFQRSESIKRVILLGTLCLFVSTPILVFNLPVFNQRVNSGNIAQDNTMNERIYLLQAGNTLFVEHSAIGVGLGASPYAMKLRFENFRVSYQPPHFTPLLAALETGVVGGGFYLLLFLAPGITFLLRWRHYVQQPMALGVFALLLAISVVNLFDYYTWMYAPGRLWQWLAWGLYSAVLEQVG
jgi:O-antigen ligase